MKLACILVLFVLSNVSSYVLLKKYGSAIMTDQNVLFESKEFDDDEEMYFKLQAGINDFDYNNNPHNIIYYYTDSTGTTSNSPYYAYRKSYNTEQRSIENNYFTIKKKGVNIDLQMEIIIFYLIITFNK